MRQKTLLNIVGLMRQDLEKGFTIFEISRLLKIGYRPAYNHIAEMEKEQLIAVERVGNAKQCRLNLANPKTRHLLESLDINKKEALFKKYPKLKGVLESIISRLTEKFPSQILSIVLFGSYARGMATKQSDIDLLFFINDFRNKHLRTAIEGEAASYHYSHNMKINPLITDIEELKKMLQAKELNIGKEVKKEGISLYGHETFWRVMA